MMYNCEVCLKELDPNETFQFGHNYYCRKHYIGAQNESLLKTQAVVITKPMEVDYPLGCNPVDLINKPEHYHKYDMDTITFLEKGFPPEVSRGFALGSAMKYLHRSELKNGIEDLEKAEFYIKKLIEYKRNEKNPSQ